MEVVAGGAGKETQMARDRPEWGVLRTRDTTRRASVLQPACSNGEQFWPTIVVLELHCCSRSQLKAYEPWGNARAARGRGGAGEANLFSAKWRFGLLSAFSAAFAGAPSTAAASEAASIIGPNVLGDVKELPPVIEHLRGSKLFFYWRKPRYTREGILSTW